MDILIGADPELFVRDGANRNISGHNLIPGDKRNPHPVEKGAVQVDGTALEFNIAPARTQEEFVGNVKAVLAQLKAMIPADYNLALEAVARYEEDYFRNLPDAVKAMGCDPDFDAYTGVEIEHKGVDRPFRTASGHVHIGWTKDEDPFTARHYQSCRTLTKELDVWLGLPSVIFDPESRDRRQLYGKAGSFRPKPYGCEYRVLSNKWLQSEELMGWVFAQTKRAFDRLMSGAGPLSSAIDYDTTQKAINQSDAGLAERILTMLRVPNLTMPDGKAFAPQVQTRVRKIEMPAYALRPVAPKDDLEPLDILADDPQWVEAPIRRARIRKAVDGE